MVGGRVRDVCYIMEVNNKPLGKIENVHTQSALQHCQHYLLDCPLLGTGI
jgi:hypothetical protein